jgi:hypothetical protein
MEAAAVAVDELAVGGAVAGPDPLHQRAIVAMPLGRGLGLGVPGYRQRSGGFHGGGV